MKQDTIKEILHSRIDEAVSTALKEVGLGFNSFALNVSSSIHADYSCPVGFEFAKIAEEPPAKFARRVADSLLKVDKKYDTPLIKELKVDGGYLNIFINDQIFANQALEVAARINEGDYFVEYALEGKKINLEFISANPTGRLHIGHGRGAFYGDMLANILSYAGADVTREFYINDSRESAQIRELGKTALEQGEQYKTPELEKIISQIDFSGMNEEEAGFLLAQEAQKSNRGFIERDLGIKFDVWYSEDGKLRASGANDKMLAELEANGLVYEKDGAKWLKTGEYGDDEDRVLVRSDHTFSYFLSDITYHADKFARGYDAVLDVWGADHHGHVKRMQAVHRMLGWKGELKVFITQLVTLKEGGEAKKMSKRAGTVILLEDLVREFGIDVVRWFFAEKALSTHMEFDAELAREESAKNPVYYVQYAHARIASILAKLGERAAESESVFGGKIKKFSHPSERELAKKIIAFPEVIADIAEDYQVHRLTTYVYELAHAFTMFYRDVKVIEENGVNANALALVLATRQVIRKSLELLGINAPDKM